MGFRTKNVGTYVHSVLRPPHPPQSGLYPSIRKVEERNLTSPRSIKPLTLEVLQSNSLVILQWNSVTMPNSYYSDFWLSQIGSLLFAFPLVHVFLLYSISFNSDNFCWIFHSHHIFNFYELFPVLCIVLLNSILFLLDLQYLLSESINRTVLHSLFSLSRFFFHLLPLFFKFFMLGVFLKCW